MLVRPNHQDYIQFLATHQVPLTYQKLQVYFIVTSDSYKGKLHPKLNFNPVFFLLPNHCWL